MEEIIKKVTEQFSNDECVEIITPFTQIGSILISGKIMIDFKGVKIPFETTLPVTYPMTRPHSDNVSIAFTNEELIGYSHINNDGSVCFHPNKDENFNRKIKAELSGLKEWIYNYYILDKEDERYTYLIPNVNGKMLSTLYFGDNVKECKLGDFGTYSYTFFSRNNIGDGEKVQFTFDSFFKLGFDNEHEEGWSKDFITFLNHNRGNLKNGLWCYIEQEPIKNLERKRLLVSSWLELQSFLPYKFLLNIYNILRRRNRSYLKDNELHILLGYKIPTEDDYEVNWNLLKINLKDSPLRKKKVNKNPGIVKCIDKGIIWGRTVNSSYNRFFGRGRLSDKLTNSKILIIGIGALGSSLAEVLVRGGAKDIFIDDFDIVEPGNLCRANYSLNDLGFSKVESLKNRLISISPFVNVDIRISKINTIKKEQLEQDLNDHFEYIFDCSTDAEISFILDRVNFKGVIYSLGITNNAQHLTCITGDNIAQETAILYDCLENESVSFFEGAGCGYPTFNANFNDISTVLNLAVKKLNDSLNANRSIDSFYIKNLSKDNSQIEIIEYDKFYQKNVNHYLFFPKTFYHRIESAFIQHYPKEFGGIFIGSKSSKFDAVVIEDILFPKKFENGKAEFIRHPESLNERLETIFNKSGGRIEYLGEFHSHPNTPAIPSKIDRHAMTQIAKVSTVTTDNPILMIGKIKSSSLVESNFYIFSEKNLLEFEQLE